MNKCRFDLWFHLRLAAGIAALIFCALLTLARPASAGETPCFAGPRDVAARNQATLHTLPVAPFGRQEAGWAIYAPLIGNEIGVGCSVDTPGFARVLAAWQGKHGLVASGAVDAQTLLLLKGLWQAKRPFILNSRHGGCPAAPAERALARAAASESYGGKTILLQPQALAAYRQMAAAARGEGLIPSNSSLFTIFSGFRSPAYDGARCARQHNCQGLVRASCSAHRTGFAMDVNLGAAPGFTPDSSADTNRLYLAQTPLYRWLVANAARFGFANYAFEPWHWEYVGVSSLRAAAGLSLAQRVAVSR
jgi:LAS superfamily LD-carboxypeptidase LdcB